MSTGQSAVMLCGWEVKTGWLIPYVDKRVGGMWSLVNTCQPERFRDEYRTQDAGASLLTNTRRRDHILLVLRQLHWLPVQRRVEFKIACLVHQSLASTAPTYLSADIHFASEHGRHLRSSSYRSLAVPWTRTTFGDRSFTGQKYNVFSGTL